MSNSAGVPQSLPDHEPVSQKSRNLVFLTSKTLKGQLFKQVDCNFITDFSDPKSSRDFRETGPRRLTLISASRGAIKVLVFAHGCRLLATLFPDINECEIPGKCSQVCRNTKGSFKCSCLEGYVLDLDGRKCRSSGKYAPFLSSWLFTSSFWNERESVCKG